MAHPILACFKTGFLLFWPCPSLDVLIQSYHLWPSVELVGMLQCRNSFNIGSRIGSSLSPRELQVPYPPPFAIVVPSRRLKLLGGRFCQGGSSGENGRTVLCLLLSVSLSLFCVCSRLADPGSVIAGDLLHFAVAHSVNHSGPVCPSCCAKEEERIRTKVCHKEHGNYGVACREASIQLLEQMKQKRNPMRHIEQTTS